MEAAALGAGGAAPPRVEDFVRELGCVTEAAAATQIASSPASASTSATASGSRKGVIKTTLKHHGSDLGTKCTTYLAEAFDREQDKELPWRTW